MTKEQKWHEMIAKYVRDRGAVAEPSWPNVQHHHVAGRTYRQNKIHIGWAFVNPMPAELHDVHSNHRLNVTHFPKAFTEVYGNQRDLWMDMVEWMQSEGWELPFDQDLIGAVMTTRF